MNIVFYKLTRGLWKAFIINERAGDSASLFTNCKTRFRIERKDERGKVQMTVFDVWKSLKKATFILFIACTGKRRIFCRRRFKGSDKPLLMKRRKTLTSRYLIWKKTRSILPWRMRKPFRLWGKASCRGENPAFLTAEKRRISLSIISVYWKLTLRSRHLIPCLFCLRLMKSSMNGKS